MELQPAAADDGVHSERSQRNAGHGAFVDSDLHTVRDDEPGGRASAIVRPGWNDGFVDCLNALCAVDGGEGFSSGHSSHRATSAVDGDFQVDAIQPVIFALVSPDSLGGHDPIETVSRSRFDRMLAG